MILVVCLDDKNGIMFNGQRQSMDKVVRTKILESANGRPLYMSEYSSQQFVEESADNIVITNSLSKEFADGTIFLEDDMELAFGFCMVNELHIYRWNRVYPSDRFFTMHTDDSMWEFYEEENFAGYSHEKITKQIYRAKKRK